jgi:hypothetical protein
MVWDLNKGLDVRGYWGLMPLPISTEGMKKRTLWFEKIIKIFGKNVD